MAKVSKTLRAKRRHAALLALLVTLFGIFVLVPSATAVHDLDLFELDGNAVDDGLASPFGGDDWDNVFAGTDSALETSFETDVFNAGNTDPVFTGGSTKDDLDITGWLCKRGGAVDKNDIEHAFAAAYNDEGDLIIYFGADKFSVSGDAQIGFWFFKNPVGCTPSGGGTGTQSFSGAHEVGDLLILSDFTTGGSVSTVRAFSWVGSGGDTNGTLQSLLTADDCDDVGLGDDLCAQVNPLGNETTGGWTYQQKNNLIGPPPEADSGNYPKGAFYEGGVNLSELLEGDVGCFSTFMAETRQSQSVNAILEDFSIGTFDTCQATIETTPSDPDRVIFLGDSITDSAEIEGTGLVAPPPEGTVDFFVCGPLAAGALCTTGGTALGSRDLTGNTDNPVEVTSDVFTPTAVGRYCFRADWTDDDNYDDASDSRETECFQVIEVTISTTQTFTVKDSATISVTGGGTLTGNVRFRLYPNGDCSGTTTLVDQTIPINAASPQTKETTPVSITTSQTTLSWLVEYTGTPANVTSPCATENASLSIDNG